MQCLNCSITTNNPKFCSMSCAAKYNNKMYPKRPKTQSLCSCGSPKTTRSKFCKTCRPKAGQDLTLAEARYSQHGQQNKYSLIRQRARYSAQQAGMTCCSKCGYSKHVEIAHIKPVHSFPDTTMISEINHISNLLALCPNCHWEFDHP